MNRLLKGSVSLPGSKSESNRALMIAAYSGFPLQVENLSDAHDTALLKALLEDTSSTIDCEDAGTVARFLLTYLANKPGTWLLTGTPRLCERPMAPLVDALRQLGAEIIGDSLPLKIAGKSLRGGSITLDASQSSQFASSLLLAAPTWEHGLQLTLTGDPVSMPYLEMTIKIMEHYGIQVVREDGTITVAHQPYQYRPFAVSSDWSAASYWYEMMALSDGRELLLKGLINNSLQGDAVVAKWFEHFGVVTIFEEQGVRLTKVPADPHDLVFDFSNTPDLFPSIFVTSVALGYRARFQGVQNLSIKESNRVESLISELSKIYTFINIYSCDELVIDKSVLNESFSNTNNVIFKTYLDHRIAMSLAPLAMQIGSFHFDNPDVVTKSYPTFWNDVTKILQLI
jgi:3-phosphoshikimate 1-carboxyvinyltransferase